MRNYDRVGAWFVVLGYRSDRAHMDMVAAQTFRSDNPLAWAKRYLQELEDADHQT